MVERLSVKEDVAGSSPAGGAKESKMQEIWRPIKNYYGKYEVSNFGRVRSLHYNNSNKTKVLAQKTNHGGYCQVSLCSKGKVKFYSVHRLVAEAFLKDFSDDKQVNHIDCDKTNNHLTNLEMCTAKENMDHAVRNGLLRTYRGENHPQSKLTNEQVKEIKTSPLPNIKLAKKFGVHRSLISMIRAGKVWKSVV